MSDDDRAGEFGPIYLPALQRIRDLWLELEPLVDATSYDDVVAPTELPPTGETPQNYPLTALGRRLGRRTLRDSSDGPVPQAVNQKRSVDTLVGPTRPGSR